MLTPLDIKNKTFSKGFRGYEAEEVDKFMQELQKEYEYLYLDNVELKGTIERVSSKLEYYQQMEATMQSTMTMAQENADELKKSSEKKAALLEHETKVKCEQLLAKAQEAAAQLNAEAMKQAEDVYGKAKTQAENIRKAAEAESRQLKEETQSFVAKMRSAAEVEVAKLKVTTDDLCKKRINSANAEAAKTMETAREAANKMTLEANSLYRKIVGDAEERSRKIVFEAEARAAVAENAYADQVKKAMVHRKHMEHLLETQLELLRNFEAQEKQ